MKKHFTRFIALLICLLMLASLVPAGVFAYSDSDYDETAYVLTGDGVTDIIGIALTQVGYHEGNNVSEAATGTNTSGSGNYVKYSTYGNLGYGNEWCAQFIVWCSRKAGLDASCGIPANACRACFKDGTSYSMNMTAKNANKYTPVAGDLIVFGYNGKTRDTWNPTNAVNGHIGLVYKVTDTTVYTIEGNSGNCVGFHSYALSDPSIMGYGTPAYPKAEVQKSTGLYVTTSSQVVRKTPSSSGTAVTNLAAKKYININGFSGDWAKVAYVSSTGSAVNGWIPKDSVFMLNSKGYKLSADKDEYIIGEDVSVTVSGLTTSVKQAVVRLYKAGTFYSDPTAPLQSIDSYTSSGSKNGTYTFSGLEAGDYELYLTSTNTGGYLYYSLNMDPVTFTVSNAAGATVKPDQRTYAPGEPIAVAWQNSAGDKDWIGLYPAGTTPGADNPALLWDYAADAEGKLILSQEFSSGTSVSSGTQVPTGTYDICLCENDGYTVLDRVTIEITDETEGDYICRPKISSMSVTSNGERTGCYFILPGDSTLSKCTWNSALRAEWSEQKGAYVITDSCYGSDITGWTVPEDGFVLIVNSYNGAAAFDEANWSTVSHLNGNGVVGEPVYLYNVDLVNKTVDVSGTWDTDSFRTNSYATIGARDGNATSPAYRDSNVFFTDLTIESDTVRIGADAVFTAGDMPTFNDPYILVVSANDHNIYNALYDCVASTGTNRLTIDQPGEYYAILVNVNSDGDMIVESRPVFFSVVDSDATVEGFTASAGASRIVLSWSSFAGASSYTVFIEKNGEWTALGTTEEISYVVSDLEPTTSYTFAVRASGPSGYVDSDYAAASATTVSFYVADFSVTAYSTYADMTWSAAEGAAGYKVYVKSGDSYQELSDIQGTSYQATGLTASGTYTFAVRAYDALGFIDSGYTEAEVSTAAPSVENVRAVPGLSGATLSWNSFDGAAKYRIGVLNDGAWTSLVSTSALSYSVTGLSSSTEYTYGVRALNSSGAPIDSGYTAITFSTRDIPVYNVNTSTLKYNYAVLKWDAPEDAYRYALGKYENGEWTLVKWLYDAEAGIAGLTRKTEYTYGIRCQNSNKSYIDTGYQPITFTTPDVVIENIYPYLVESSCAIIKWNAVDIAEYYTVCQLVDGQWVTIKNAYTNMVSLSALEPNTEYTIGIRARGAKKAILGSFQSVTIRTYPECTTTVTAAEVGASYVSLTWDEMPEAAKYQVCIYKDNTWVELKNVFTNSVKLSGLVPETEYKYGIRGVTAEKRKLGSGFSQVTFTTLAAQKASPAVSSVSSDKATLVWSEVPGTYKYRVSVYADKTWTLVKDVYEPTVTLSGLVKNSTYTYGVRCMDVNKNYLDGWYSTVTFTTEDAPVEAIAGFEVSRALNGATFMWTDAERADTYDIVDVTGSQETVLATVGSDVSCFTADNITEGIHDFKVMAYNTETGKRVLMAENQKTGVEILSEPSFEDSYSQYPSFITVPYSNGGSLYVSTKGSDSNDGSFEHPYRTVGYAMNAAKPGDTIYVRGGTYAEWNYISNSGEEGAYITVRPYNNEKVVMDDNYATDSSCFVFQEGSSYWRLLDLEICRYEGAGVWIKGSCRNIYLENLDIHDISEAKYSTSGTEGILGDGENILVRNCRIYDISTICRSGTDHGIYIHSPHHWIIDSNYFGNIPGGAIHQYSGEYSSITGTDVYITNNFMKECRDGIVLSSAQRFYISNNTIYNCMSSDIFMLNEVRDCVIQNNIFYSDYKVGATYIGKIWGVDAKGEQTVTNKFVYSQCGSGECTGNVFSNNVLYHEHLPYRYAVNETMKVITSVPQLASATACTFKYLSYGADPGFMKPEYGIFDLKSTSTLLKGGVRNEYTPVKNIAGYDRSTVSIGAY